MGNTGNQDKVEGKTNKAAGSIREKAGEMLNDNEMQAKGTAQKTKGKVQDNVGGAKNALKDDNKDDIH